MLAEKFESGPFWLIHSQLSNNQKPQFHSFWGKLFERYIANLFISAATSSINVVQESPLFSGTNEELCDTMVFCGQNAVLIEAKSAMITARAKYEGDYKLLQQELGIKARQSEDRKMPVKQRWHGISSALSDRKARAVDTASLKYITTVFPVIITRDDIGV